MHCDNNYNKYIERFQSLNSGIKEYNEKKQPVNKLFQERQFKKISQKVEVIQKFDTLLVKINQYDCLDCIDISSWMEIEKNARIFSTKAKPNELAPESKVIFRKKCLDPILEYIQTRKAKDELPEFLDNMKKILDNPKNYTFDKSFQIQQLPCKNTVLVRHVIEKCQEMSALLLKQTQMIPEETLCAFSKTCEQYIDTFCPKESEKKQLKRKLAPLFHHVECLDPSNRISRMASSDSTFTNEAIVKTLKTLHEERCFIKDVLMDSYFELLKGIALQKFLSLGGVSKQYDSKYFQIDWMQMRQLTSPDEMGLCLRMEKAHRSNSPREFISVLREEIANKENLSSSAKSILSIWLFLPIIADLDKFEYLFKDGFYDDEKRMVRPCNHLSTASIECQKLLEIAQNKLFDPAYLLATTLKALPSERIEYLTNYIDKINKIALSIQEKFIQTNELYEQLYLKVANDSHSKKLLIETPSPSEFFVTKFAVCSIEDVYHVYEEFFGEDHVDEIIKHNTATLLVLFCERFDQFFPSILEQVKLQDEMKGPNEDTKEKVKEVQKFTQNKKIRNNKNLAQRVLEAHEKFEALEKEQKEQEKLAKITKKLTQLSVEEKKDNTSASSKTKKKRKRKTKKHDGILVQNLDQQIRKNEKLSVEKEKEKEKEKEVVSVSVVENTPKKLKGIRERPIIEKQVEIHPRIQDWFLDSPIVLQSDKYSTKPSTVQEKVKLFHTYPLFMARYEQKFGMRILQQSTKEKTKCSYTLIGQIECYGENYLHRQGKSLTYRGFFTSAFSGNEMYHHCFTERPYNEILEEVSHDGFVKLDEELHSDSLSSEKDSELLNTLETLNPDRERYKITKTKHTVTCDDVIEKVRYTMCLTRR